jgi:hypothetical protein
MGTNSEVPLTQCLERSHLLDVVRVEMLELQPKNNTPQMNRPVGTEKPHSWKATNDTTNPLKGRDTDSSPGTFHSMAAVSGGSWPASTMRRSCLRETLERVQFDIAAAESWAGWKRKERWRCGC